MDNNTELNTRLKKAFKMQQEKIKKQAKEIETFKKKYIEQLMINNEQSIEIISLKKSNNFFLNTSIVLTGYTVFNKILSILSGTLI
jgi:hypothetical protein